MEFQNRAEINQNLFNNEEKQEGNHSKCIGNCLKNTITVVYLAPWVW